MTSKLPTRPVRSSRRGRHAPFDLGDVVEVDYQNGIVHGRLIAKVTNDPPPVTRWLVQYHEPGVKQEEIVCEKSFGAIIEKASPSTIAAMKAKTRSNLPAAAPQSLVSVPQNLVSVPQNLLEETQPASSKEGRTSLSPSPTSSAVHISIKENVPTPHRSSTSTTSSSNSSTEGTASSNGSDVETDHISHPKTSTNVKVIIPMSKVTTKSMETTPQTVLSEREKRRLKREEASRLALQKKQPKRAFGHSPLSSAPTKKRKRNGKLDKAADEEVIKVKLNTGTLYLYRGLNRRAVFIRRV